MAFVFRSRIPSGLLLDVWTASGCGAPRAPDHAHEGDEREDVRQGLEEVGGGEVGREERRALEPEGERAREAEEEARAEGAERPPVPEDDGRQGDVAPARGHVLVEGVAEPEGE